MVLNSYIFIKYVLILWYDIMILWYDIIDGVLLLQIVVMFPKYWVDNNSQLQML